MEIIRDLNGEIKQRYFMADGIEYRIPLHRELNKWDDVRQVDY